MGLGPILEESWSISLPKLFLPSIFFWAVVLVHVCCLTKQENKNLLEPGYMSLHCPNNYNPHGKLHPNAIESLKFFNNPRPFAGAAEKWRFAAENALKRDFSRGFFLVNPQRISGELSRKSWGWMFSGCIWSIFFLEVMEIWDSHHWSVWIKGSVFWFGMFFLLTLIIFGGMWIWNWRHFGHDPYLFGRDFRG